MLPSFIRTRGLLLAVYLLMLGATPLSAATLYEKGCVAFGYLSALGRPARRAALDLDLYLLKTVEQARAKLQNKEPMHDENLGNQFRAEMENEDLPPWAALMPVLKMADPGVRQFVQKQYFAEIDRVLQGLSEKDQILLLTRLAGAENARARRSGIRNNPGTGGKRVWDFLAIRNEYTNFVNARQIFAADKLAQKNSAQALASLAFLASHDLHDPPAVFARKRMAEMSAGNPTVVEGYKIAIKNLEQVLAGYQKEVVSSEAEERSFRRAFPGHKVESSKFGYWPKRGVRETTESLERARKALEDYQKLTDNNSK